MVRKKPTKKQVKTFSTNGEVYDWLVSTFESSHSRVSVSELLNDYLGYLYYEIRRVLDYYAQEKIVVDQAWIVNRILQEVKFFPPKLDVLYTDPDMKRWMDNDIHIRAMELLEQYQQEQRSLMDNIRSRRAVGPRQSEASEKAAPRKERM